MATRYHIGQADYPHATADAMGISGGTNAPTQRTTSPTFGLIAYSHAPPVKASQEAINTTAIDRPLSFAGKTTGGRHKYSPGPGLRSEMPGVHSGTSHAKNAHDVHQGTGAVGVNAATVRMKPRPFGKPPSMMTGNFAKAFSRAQSGVPSTPGARKASGAQATAQGPQGKVPTVNAAVIPSFAKRRGR